MNPAYLRAQQSAERMIKKNGSLFLMKMPGDVVIDPVTEEPTSGTEARQQNITAVILPPGGDPFSSKVDQYRDSNGVLDLSKVRKIIISTVGLEWTPEPQKCLVFYDNDWWMYDQAVPINPDGELDIVITGMIRR